MLTTLNYTVDGCQKVETKSCSVTEQEFWREVSACLFDVDIPSVLSIDTPFGSARLNITERGTYQKNGEEHPSMFVIPVFNNIDLKPSTYEDAYLTCINPDTRGGRGNYKFYRLSQRPDGLVTARYGRIGQHGGFGSEREIKDPMPSWMFEIRKAEKMTKGYVDRTSTFCQGSAHVVGEETPIETVADNLYQRLLSFAQHRVSSSLMKGTVVTTTQVDDCQKLLNRLGRCRKVESFNERLLDIMSISPRSVASVAAEMARTSNDFGRIIDREESLLAAMRAVASDADAPKKAARDGFIAKGINWNELVGEELARALAHVPSKLRNKVSRVYSIDPEGQRKRFASYLEKRGMDESDVRLMWHGSRNENWCSIVASSLILNPNAQITGKMFGYGIYFGYDNNDGGAYKSWNYTSAYGSYWAHGNSNTAFMGLYECAYGKPHHPNKVNSFSKTWLDSNGFDCVHARGGDCGLYHDEVVFYDEAAVCLKYLYEFSV